MVDNCCSEIFAIVLKPLLDWYDFAWGLGVGTVGRSEKPLQDTYMRFKGFVDFACVGNWRWVRKNILGCSNFMRVGPFSKLQWNSFTQQTSDNFRNLTRIFRLSACSSHSESTIPGKSTVYSPPGSIPAKFEWNLHPLHHRTRHLPEASFWTTRTGYQKSPWRTSAALPGLFILFSNTLNCLTVS